MTLYSGTAVTSPSTGPEKQRLELAGPYPWFGVSFWSLVAILAVAIIALWLSMTPVAAQSYCGERAEITKSLGVKYHEKLVASGLAEGGAMIEIFASSKGSWTMLMTTPSGMTCYMASGEGWENMPQLAKGTKI